MSLIIRRGTQREVEGTVGCCQMLSLVVGTLTLDIAAAATLSFDGSLGGATARRETQRDVEGMVGSCQMLSWVAVASTLDIAAPINLSFGGSQRCCGSIGALLVLVVASAARRFCLATAAAAATFGFFLFGRLLLTRFLQCYSFGFCSCFAFFPQ